LQAQKIAEMQRLKKQQEAQDAFRAGIGQPNATRDVITQPSEQVPVPAAPDATAPSFATQMQAPVVSQEQYYDPQVMMQQALQSGALPFDKYLELQAKENKPQGKLLTDSEAKANGLPTESGQKWNKTQNGTFEIVTGTAPSTKSSVSILTNAQAKSLNLPTGRGQVYQQDKATNKIDLIEGTVAPASASGDGSVDFLDKNAQAMAAALYLKTGTLPPLGGGKNAALAKANIMNMAALMNQGKSPEDAANSVFQNKQNRAAEQQALKTFAGGIEIDTHLVHTTFYHNIQALLELVLIHIVLVLSDTNGLGIDFYQLRQWIGEPSANRNGASQGDVLIRKFFSRHFRR
jgi:hypothetical protein